MKKPSGGSGFRITDSTNVGLIGNISRNNAGDGFTIERSSNVTGQGNEASNNGRRISIPETPVVLSPDDLEAAKQILKTTPESSWQERLQTIKAIGDIGKDVVLYIPAIVSFVRALL
jgi:parallel beta-helix repeat protein